MKIRDAKRLALGALGFAALFALGLLFRTNIEPLVNQLPTRVGHDYLIGMILLAIFSITLTYAAIWSLLTSPAQDAEYLVKLARKGELPTQIDPKLIDPNDPDFEVRTLDYLRKKRAAKRKN